MKDLGNSGPGKCLGLGNIRGPESYCTNLHAMSGRVTGCLAWWHEALFPAVAAWLASATFRLLAGAGFRFAFDEDGLLCAGGISMMGSAAQQGAQVSAKKGDSYASNPGLRQKYGRHDGLSAAERKASAAKQPSMSSPR